MSTNIEIWKIFEDDHLATYAFGDLGLFGAKAKGKVVLLKKNGDVFLVEQTDKSLTKNGFNNVYAPKIQQALTDFRKQGVYPDRKSLTDSVQPVPARPDVAIVKGSAQWRNVVKTDAIRDKLDKILISFFANSSDGFAKLIGAGFIVVAAGRKALVMTASHIFHIHGLIQAPKSVYPSKYKSEFKIHPGELFSVDAEKIKAVYQPESETEVCIISGISIIPEIDIALCAVELDKDYKGLGFYRQLGLDSSFPEVGEEVVAIGFSGKNSDWRQVAGDKKKSYAEMIQQVEMRTGKVTGIFPHGSRHESWPCFETTIPVDAGMHGGPVLPFDPSSLTMNACAVVSADMSPQSSFYNFSAPGYSVMAMIWPSLFLPFGAEDKQRDQAAVNNLRGLIQKGRVKDVGDANKRINIISKSPKALTISLKEQ